jgi:predicted TPR repeat methyltransferase
MDGSQRRHMTRLGRGDGNTLLHGGHGGDTNAVIQRALELGLQFHRAGDFQLAAEHYYDALEARHDQHDALHLLGLISFQSGEVETAKRLIGRAIEVSVDDPVPHVTMGDLLHAETHYHEAVEAYRRGLEIDPELAEAHNNCGNAQNALGLHEDAMASFKHALALKPGYVAALNNLANALRDLGRPGDAAINYRHALAFHPDSATIHNNLGNALRDLGDIHGAVTSHRTALDINPNVMEAHFNLGNALSGLGDFEAAVVHYSRAIELQPRFVDGHYNLGNARREMGEFNLALECYHRAVSIDPGHSDAYNNLGNLLADLGSFDQAVAAFRIVLEIDPDSANARHMAAALSGETTAAAPPGYVRELFDAHADIYDGYIVDELEYRAPAFLRDLIEELGHGRPKGCAPKFGLGLDIGCGTGLTGQALEDLATAWVGVDLSPNMIAEAAKKNLYERLHEAEIIEFLEAERGRISPHRDFADLVVAGDVFTYTGDLDPVFAGVRGCISRDGLFAFTTERVDGGGYVLNRSGRYGHDDDYIRDLAADRDFEIVAHRVRKIRTEDGVAVTGSVFVLKPR